MIVLPPFPPRRAWLMSFGLVMSLVSGLLIGALLSLRMSPCWFAVGVVVALMLSLPGLLWPQTVSIPYRVWNKLAYEFSRFARLWLTGICFYIVFVTVGRLGSSFKLASLAADESLWVSREISAPAAYGSSHGIIREEPSEEGWVSAFVSWAMQSGNGWACCLLPFLMLLSAFESEQQEESDLPTHTYTLF
jgi:hypothetical protein